ncbi:MAG: tyrosine-type recombinase/integrase [Methyloprofundus sp.]|nr:tyrosine-type recombinase/integrase [Methyloprofundus sp.]
MTPLRQKMIDLMAFRQFASKTQQAYLGAVIKLSTYYHRSPDQIDSEEVKHWLMTTACERNWSASTVHQTMMALKFCYHHVLEQEDFFLDLPLPKRPQKIPVLLTQKEVYSILQATHNLKHLTLLSLCYGCGLRVSELVALTQDDIDSERLLLRVVQGKGKKDRSIPLSSTLLDLLRVYWQAWHPKHYLFCSCQQQKKALGISSVQKVFTKAKLDAGIHKAGGIHSLRHAYATHQLEHGLPIHQLQLFLGHGDIRVTLKYLHWVPGTQVMASDLLAQFAPDDRLMHKPEVSDEPF